MNAQGFNAGLKAKLVAAGFTEKEMQLGAIMAEMQGAMKLIGNPLAAMAVSNTFSKALALLSVHDEVNPERTCAASDIIFEAAMGHAREQLTKLRREQVGDQAVPGVSNSQQPAGERTVMSADLDDTPAIDPKDIN